mmetsp:Transcript_50559/g.159173  ORF Transcript_50559/g.159173 Transcript_50559/m.159173 type:complete len:309 (+) Transcript_50559:1044-1970(+)
MATVESVLCTSCIAATAMISAPCFTNFRNLASAPLTSSCRRVLISLFTKRSTKRRRMFIAGWGLQRMLFSPVISSRDFFARSQSLTQLSCTSMRSFLMRSLGGSFGPSSSSSFSFSLAFRASSSSGSSSSFFLPPSPSSFSASLSRSFISCSSWNFSGSPPLSGCSSSAIFLYILLMSLSVASGGRPRKASAERFCRPLRCAFALSRHFWMRLTSSSVTSISLSFMWSSSSSVVMVISLATASASRRPKRCFSSASVKRRMGCRGFVSPWQRYLKASSALRTFRRESSGNTMRPRPKTAVPAAWNGSA